MFIYYVSFMANRMNSVNFWNSYELHKDEITPTLASASKFDNNGFPLTIEANVKNNDAQVCLTNINAEVHFHYLDANEEPQIEEFKFTECSSMEFTAEKQ